ncbi:LPD7 domain-containing protein [Acidithiobacillus ferriphilus]|uniref:LPD7 domain-containing protein n=1 Tax=Acidithiobacillus ferriphilus TaxID=1689834 RepID=UPI00390C4F57
MSTDQKATRESLLAEFKTARDAAITKSQMGMEQIAQRHRQERADALKDFVGKRADIEAAFEKDGAPAGAWPSLMAMEQSRHMEPLIQQQTEEHAADLAAHGVSTWEGFLTEKSHAGEALAATMLVEMDARKHRGEEISKVNGFEGEPVDPGHRRLSMFDDIQSKYDQDADSVHYHRKSDGTELFEDKGSRIEMKETSSKSIETALLLAQERFKKGTPLTITGDEQFQQDAARIAGRLGIPIKNKDLMEVWQQSRDKAAMGIAEDEPDITPSNGFSGKEAVQERAAPAQDKAVPDVGNVPDAEHVAPSTSVEPVVDKDAPRKLLDHGAAPYQFKEGNTKSYYVKTQDAYGKEHVTWGVGLEKAMEDSAASKGDLIRLKHVGKELVTIPVMDKDGNPVMHDNGTPKTQTTNRNSFTIDVANRPLKASPHIGAAAAEQGYPVENGHVAIPPADYAAAKADLSVLSSAGHHAIHQVSQKPFAELQPLEKHTLISEGLADENGLNRQGVAAVITSDRQLELRRERAPEADKVLLTPGHEAGPMKAAPAVDKVVPEQSKFGLDLVDARLPEGMTVKDRVVAVTLQEGSRTGSHNMERMTAMKEAGPVKVLGYAVQREYIQTLPNGELRSMVAYPQTKPQEKKRGLQSPFATREEAEQALPALQGKDGISVRGGTLAESLALEMKEHGGQVPIDDEKEKITSPARYALHAEKLPVGMTSKDRVAAIVVKDGSRYVSDNPEKNHPGSTIKGYAVVRDYTQEFQGGHKISASRVMPNIQEDAPIQQPRPIHNPYTSREQAEQSIAALHGQAPYGQVQGVTESIEQRRSETRGLKPLYPGDQAQVQDQKRLNIRNEDQQAQEKKATEKKIESKKEIERKAQERDKSQERKQERAVTRTRTQKEVGLER